MPDDLRLTLAPEPPRDVLGVAALIDDLLARIRYVEALHMALLLALEDVYGTEVWRVSAADLPAFIRERGRPTDARS